MTVAVWAAGILGAIALYLWGASRLGKRMARNGQQYAATPPKGDEK